MIWLILTKVQINYTEHRLQRIALVELITMQVIESDNKSYELSGNILGFYLFQTIK